MFKFRKHFRSLCLKLMSNGGFATLAADNATLVAAGGVSTIIQGIVDARVKCMLDSYTLVAGTVTSGSTIDIGGKMPKGAHVIAIILFVSSAQVALTIDIGDDENSTRYASADTSLQAIGTFVFSGKNYNVDLTTASTPDDQIVITTGGAAVTAGQLEAVVVYSQD